MIDKDTGELKNLICLAANDEGSAFSRLYERYLPLIRSLAARYSSGSPQETEDLMQEAALALFRAACSYDADQNVSFGTYAGRCMTNALTSHLRQRRVVTHPLDNITETDLPAGDSDPSEICIGKEAASHILGIVRNSLSDYEIKVFSLYILAHSAKEIAASLHTSEKSVENAIYRIRIKLKTVLLDNNI